jgi:hypothetical protein
VSGWILIAGDIKNAQKLNLTFLEEGREIV